MGQLDDKVCIVTGAAGSIGLATTRLMLAEGARVMMVDISEERLLQAASNLDIGRITSKVADVTKSDQVREFVDSTVAKWGAIDVLFSNAGNDGPLIPTVDYPEDVFDSIIATHVRGCFLVCKYTLPKMKDGGSVVITSSITGVKGVSGNCSYVAAKHALVGLMRCLAKEVAPRGIRVNTVNPGPIDNEFMRTAERSMSKMLGRDAGAMFDQIIPLGRHGQIDEVARAVLFLASSQSSYTSGSTLMVDGALCA
jgi:NAD(P)-dependent dehydrogenase (short-subunit alcohol dehydrogenase family)